MTKELGMVQVSPIETGNQSYCVFENVYV